MYFCVKKYSIYFLNMILFSSSLPHHAYHQISCLQSNIFYFIHSFLSQFFICLCFFFSCQLIHATRRIHDNLNNSRRTFSSNILTDTPTFTFHVTQERKVQAIFLKLKSIHRTVSPIFEWEIGFIRSMRSLFINDGFWPNYFDYNVFSFFFFS